MVDIATGPGTSLTLPSALQPKPSLPTAQSIEGVETHSSNLPDINQPGDIASSLELPQATTPITLPGTEPSTSATSTVPDINKIQQTLQESGSLLPEFSVQETAVPDNSPLAALQPERVRNGVVFTPPQPAAAPVTHLPDVYLANTAKPLTASQLKTDEKPNNIPIFFFLGLGLFAQILQGISQLFHYILVQYPRLEQMIASGTLSLTEMNTSSMKGLVLAGFIAVSIFLLVIVFAQNVFLRPLIFYLALIVLTMNVVIQNIYLQPHFASGNPFNFQATVLEIMNSQNPSFSDPIRTLNTYSK